MAQARMFQSDAETDDEVAFMVMVLDLQDAAPSIRRLHGWALDLVQVQSGEVVVGREGQVGVGRRRGRLVGEPAADQSLGEHELPEHTAGAAWWSPMAFAAIRGEESPTLFDSPRNPVWRP